MLDSSLFIYMRNIVSPGDPDDLEAAKRFLDEDDAL